MMTIFRKAINELVAQRKVLSKQIAALEAASKTLSPTTSKPKKPKKAKKARTLDKDAGAKTLEFVRGRKRPTKPEAVEREFNLTRAAATQRLIALVHQGLAKRVGKGMYVAVRAQA
jgi:hypothetical protein